MQKKLNEKIRSAYGFLKYTERIKEEAPEFYKEAKIRWTHAFISGMELFLKSQLEDQINLMKYLVAKDTVMTQSVYTEMCAQGPTEREKWLFPWETTTH